MKRLNHYLYPILFCGVLLASSAVADVVTATVPVGSVPYAIAVNPVANKLYVANRNSNNVTVIDGATNATTTVSVGFFPYAVVVNPVSNKIYVANVASNSVTVIDGATNATTTVSVGPFPYAVAVNPTTNKVYVASYYSDSVTVIDGATNATTTVAAGSYPYAVAVNPVTNKIYVANLSSNNVTVIDGATNATTTVPVGPYPWAVGVNPVSNKIYVANSGGNTVTVIDGATNATTTVPTESAPQAVAVNPVTNKIYVANDYSSNVTVIDGATNTTTTVPAGSTPYAVAVNPVTNKIYVANQGSSNVTVIDGATNTTTSVPAGSNPKAVAVNPVTNKIYVANQDSNNVTVIDGSPFNNTTSVPTGSHAGGIGINPTTNEIYKINYFDSTVSVIDGATGTLSATIPSYSGPSGVAVNPVTNKIYVPNETSNVTVIDGATKATTSVPAGPGAYGVAVNPVTNKIYVTNVYSNDVTVIDGATNATTTVPAGTYPSAVAVNPVTNKIYVANSNSSNITVIDGATNATTTVSVGSDPRAVDVNPVTNKIYVMNLASHDVTVIDGATNDTVTIPNVPVGSHRPAIAVNSVTNKIYVLSGEIITVIDGATNTTMTVPVGEYPNSVVVNPVTNKIYVGTGGNFGIGVTVIDGATNTTTLVPASNTPQAVAVNPVTNKIYASLDSFSSADVMVIDESPRISQGYRAAPQPLPDNVSTTLPEFTLDATDALNNPIIPLGVYWQMDTMQGPWGAATANGGNSFSATVTTALTPGSHVLYTYPVQGDAGNPTIDMGTPRMGDVSAYLFTVNGQIAPQQQPQTITFPNPGDQTYGVVSITLTATASSGLAVTYAVTSGRAGVFGSNLDIGGAGSVTVRADQVGDSQWQPAPSQYVTFTVYPAVLTVTADSFTIVDGAPLPTFTASYTGFVREDGQGVLSGSPSLTTTAPQNPPVGTYPINASQGTLSAANYTFTFVNGTLTVVPAVAQITSPTKGSTLTGSTVTFTWTAENGATSYQLWLGHTTGTHDVAVVGTTHLSGTATGLPTDGSQIYATLYGYANGHWTVQDTATYTAASMVKAQITAPPKGSTLTGTTATFTWTAESGATSYQLWVGHSAGAHDIAVVGTSGLAATVSGLPQDGSQVYVTLNGYSLGAWSVQDTATYTASTTAAIISPPKGSTLPGRAATFTWSAESGATSYQLWVGNTAGAHDIAVVGTSGLSGTVSGLPTDGRQLYVTLWGYAGGVWSVQDTATYTAVTLVNAAITSPPKGSTLPGSRVTFTWTAETGGTSYQIWVGNSPGAHDILSAGTNGLTLTVGGLPTDGRVLYVTLYGYSGGVWSVQDTATYTAF